MIGKDLPFHEYMKAYREAYETPIHILEKRIYLRNAKSEKAEDEYNAEVKRQERLNATKK